MQNRVISGEIHTTSDTRCLLAYCFPMFLRFEIFLSSKVFADSLDANPFSAHLYFYAANFELKQVKYD